MVFFYWRKRTKVAEEKGKASTAFDRIRREFVVSL